MSQGVNHGPRALESSLSGDFDPESCRIGDSEAGQEEYSFIAKIVSL